MKHHLPGEGKLRKLRNLVSKAMRAVLIARIKARVERTLIFFRSATASAIPDQPQPPASNSQSEVALRPSE